jgi:hypothetical protein
MSTSEQPKPPVTGATRAPAASAPATKPAAKPANAPQSTPSVASALGDVAKSAVTSAIFEKRPYLKFAFSNPYNLSLFTGALAAAGLTLNPLLALTAIGLEALWLLYAPDSKRLRHLLWDPRFEQVREALQQQDRESRMQVLGENDRTRVTELISRQRQIRLLANSNPSFTGELLRAELVKTDRLVDAFIDMATNTARYEQYLGSVDLNALSRERTRWEVNCKSGKEGDAEVDVARKNLAIVLKRIDKLQEIKRYMAVARGQLDLIDNSFQLIADQIVTMQSPQQLSGQLDELLDGVESIRQTAVDTERILNSIGSIGNGISL